MTPTKPRSNQPPDTPPLGLSFGDGFQFGCGFFVAGMIALIVLMLLIMIIVLVLSLAGVGLLGDMLGSLGPFSLLA